MPVTTSTASWGPHDAFSTANSPYLHFNRPISFPSPILSSSMWVMYSKPFSKIIASMDSPWLELFSDILFAKFRCRLSRFPFSIWFYVKKSNQKGRIRGREERRRALPCGAQLQWKKWRNWVGAVWVGVVCKSRSHNSLLMRHQGSAPSLFNYFSSFQIPPAPKLISSVLGVPYLHPARFSAPSCTQISPWLNFSLWIDLIFFLQLILIDPFIQKSWNFHKNSLNSWWSSLYF
jgi:hypothetical protein